MSEVTAAATAPQLLRREVVLGVLLGSSSGAAILAHTFWSLPMRFTVPFVVLPTVALLGSTLLLRRRLYPQLHWFTAVLLAGAAWGLVGTVFYDVVRPIIVWAFRFSYSPYRAIPVFGQLMTGLPMTDPRALAAGWLYHFWNGVSFGMMFTLVRPRGGAVLGMIWGLTLQGFMMVTYPHLLQIRMNDPGFMTVGLVGHGLWGVVLGAGVARWRGYA
jgi:hypothetical protein